MTSEPKKGDVFESPRGVRYQVIGPSSKPGRVEVVNLKHGTKDTAFWALMIPENGWRRVPSPQTGPEQETKT